MTKKTKAQRPVGVARVETKAVAEVTVPGLLPVPLLLGIDGIKRFSPAAIALRLGASRDTANQRAKRNYSEGACMMKAPSASGPQWVLAVDLKHLSAFLLGFSAATVGEEIAPRLEEIQEEMPRALAAHAFEAAAQPAVAEAAQPQEPGLTGADSVEHAIAAGRTMQEPLDDPFSVPDESYADFWPP